MATQTFHSLSLHSTPLTTLTSPLSSISRSSFSGKSSLQHEPIEIIIPFDHELQVSQPEALQNTQHILQAQDYLLNVEPKQVSDSSSARCSRQTTSTIGENNKSYGRRLALAALSTITSAYESLSGRQKGRSNPSASSGLSRVANSYVTKSWSHQAACKLFGTCGRTHWRGRWRLGDFVDHDEDDERDEPSFPHDPNDRNKTSPDDWSDDERVIRDIPQFVLEHAPLVHLFSGEGFWPSDIAEHLLHVSPELDYVPIDTPDPNLTNLNDLNRWTKGRHVYLTSNDDPETLPDWITKEENIPEDLEDNYIRAMARADDNDRWEIVAEGKLANDKAIQEGWYEAGDGNSVEESDIADNSQHVSVRPTKVKTVGSRAYTKNPQVVKKGGRSGAPAILVVVDKGDGIVDAFWFFFYSFNLGNVVFNIRFGNHVGDWEHVCVRFQHGIPKAVFFSEHNFGDAYSYEAVQKIGKRVSRHIPESSPCNAMPQVGYSALHNTITDNILSSSRSSTLPQAPTPCTPPLEHTATSYPLDFSMTKQTVAHYGTQP